MKVNKKSLKRIEIILLVVCMVLMCFLGTGAMVNTYALEKPNSNIVKVDEHILEETIVEVNLANDFRAEKEINLDEIESVEDFVVEEPVKTLNISDVETIEEKIEVACDIHDVPYDIAMAIARLETGHFKSHAFRYKNNPGGLSINEEPMSFDTLDEGVEAFISNLSRNYIQEGLDTPKKIGKKYCPVNPKWASIVEELMEYDKM